MKNSNDTIGNQTRTVPQQTAPWRTPNCLLYTNIFTSKYCKFTLNYSDMFRC